MKRFTLLLILTMSVSFAFSQGIRKDLEMPTASFYEIDESEFTVSEIENGGKPIVFITWSKLWCNPCVQILDSIAEVYEEWRKKTGVLIIALNVDRSNSNLQEFVDEKNWPFFVAWDMDKVVAEKMNITSAPLMVFLDGKKKTFTSYLSYEVSLSSIYGTIINIGAKTQYLDENLVFCTKNKAAYSRKITRDYSDFETPYKITAYYIDGPLYFEGKASRIYPVEDYEGKCTYYYRNGKVSKTIVYTKGEQDGETKLYYKTGKLQTVVILKDGLPWEAVSSFAPNGSTLAKGTLKNGNGTHFIYNKKGKKLERNEYKEGLYHGRIERYDSLTGKRTVLMNFTDGNRDGYFKFSKPDGKPTQTGYYKMGEEDSLWMGYHDNGVLAYEVLFRNGLIDESTLYDQNGKTVIDYVTERFAKLDINAIIEDPGEFKGKEYAEIQAISNVIENTIEEAIENFAKTQELSLTKDFDDVFLESMSRPEVKKFYISYFNYLQLEVLSPIPEHKKDTLEIIRTEWTKALRSVPFDPEDIFEAIDQEEYEDFFDSFEEEEANTIIVYFLMDVLLHTLNENLTELLETDDLYEDFKDYLIDLYWIDFSDDAPTYY